MTEIPAARRTAAPWAATMTAAAAAAALVLTSCSTAEHHHDPPAPRPGRSTLSPAAAAPSARTPTPTTTRPVTTPTFGFPSDVRVTVDADRTGDTTKDAVLRDQAYGLKAIFLAIAKLDPTLPVLPEYLSAQALGDWISKIKWGQDQHTTVTGTTRFYQRRVHMTGSTTAGVTWCQSDRDAYDKSTLTGKTRIAGSSTDDFTLHYTLMSKGADGIWKMTTYQSQTGATQCRR